MTLLEVCVDDAMGLAEAVAGGADRIELCSTLEMGGLTPSPGLIALAAQQSLSVRAMVRPRPGDFVMSAADVEVMLGDIAGIRAAGLEGVVLGASRPDGRLDVDCLETLVGASQGLGKTLHRAFDLVPDVEEAVELAVGLGFDTILTSGCAKTAIEGMEQIAKAHAVAAGRITIMAGSGIDADNVVQLLERVPLAAVHGSCSVPARSDSEISRRFGFESPVRKATAREKVSAMKSAIKALS